MKHKNEWITGILTIGLIAWVIVLVNLLVFFNQALPLASSKVAISILFLGNILIGIGVIAFLGYLLSQKKRK